MAYLVMFLFAVGFVVALGYAVRAFKGRRIDQAFADDEGDNTSSEEVTEQGEVDSSDDERAGYYYAYVWLESLVKDRLLEDVDLHRRLVPEPREVFLGYLQQRVEEGEMPGIDARQFMAKVPLWKKDEAWRNMMLGDNELIDGTSLYFTSDGKPATQKMIDEWEKEKAERENSQYTRDVASIGGITSAAEGAGVDENVIKALMSGVDVDSGITGGR